MSKSTTQTYHYGVGRRKACTARAKYFPSESELSITVNGKPLQDYFPEYYTLVVTEALKNLGIKTGTFQTFARSGGVTGQAEAIRLAIIKALIHHDNTLKPTAKLYKYVTTDNRKVLPKRPGLRKARKREQWAKR